MQQQTRTGRPRKPAINVTIPRDTFDRAVALARRRLIPISEVTARALLEYLEKEEARAVAA